MRKRWFFFLVSGWIGAAMLSPSPTQAQERERMERVFWESQQTNDGPDWIVTVLWLNEGFLTETIRKVTSDQAAIQATLDTLRPVLTFTIMAQKISPAGAQYVPGPTLLSNLFLVEQEGREIPMLTTIPPATYQFLRSVFQAIQQAGGTHGQNTSLVCFPALREDGTPRIDPRQKGELKLVLKSCGGLPEQTFQWKLPLECLMPKKICTQCQETVKHAWNYCPWCGHKLPE